MRIDYLVPLFALLVLGGCFLFAPSTNEYPRDAAIEDASDALDGATIDDQDTGLVEEWPDAGELPIEPLDASQVHDCETVSGECFSRYDGGSTTDWGRKCRAEYEACVRG